MFPRSHRRNRRRSTRSFASESLEPRQLLTVPDPISTVPVHVEQYNLFTDAELTTPGLVGSFVNRSLRDEAAAADWREIHNITGTRVDTALEFWVNGWGDQSQVGLTNGTDDSWEDFSVQWDGYVQITDRDTQLWMASDDGGRFWIDLNNNGEFEDSELSDNNWGTGQVTRLNSQTPPIDEGVYAIRVQYEEGTGENDLRLGSGAMHEFRIAYLIPEDRSPRQDVYDNLRFALPEYNNWLAEEFARHGIEPHQFAYEQDTDGTPKVHVLQIAGNAEDYHGTGGEIYDSVRNAAYDAGVSRWAPGENWILIHEAAELNQDGTIDGRVAVSAFGGNGSGSGVVVLDSVAIGLADLETMQNDRAYNGEIVPEIGPYPLVEGVSFSTNYGQSFSSVASSSFGRLLRSMAVSIGVRSNSVNDSVRNGPLLGNGFRGIRNWYFPDDYPNDQVYLSTVSAEQLASSRFLNPEDLYTDEVSPTIEEAEILGITEGQLEVRVRLTDNIGLESAQLARGSNTMASIALDGTSATFTLKTPDVLNQQDQTFRLTVFDQSGRRSVQDLEFSAIEIPNTAPIPKVKLSDLTVQFGDPVTLDASGSFDRDGENSALRYEWDLDGDGAFDTSPSLQQIHSFNPTTSGPRSVSVRITDEQGAQSVSQPLALLVQPPEFLGNVDGDDDFDGNDAFLIQLVFLSASDVQIDQFKGASSLTAEQIRTAVDQMAATVDIDGVNDFDANDAFLIQLVQLSGTNTQIDQFKGSSPRAAQEIRAAIESLGVGNQQQTTSGFDRLGGAGETSKQYLASPINAHLRLTIAEDNSSAIANDVPESEFRSWLSLL